MGLIDELPGMAYRCRNDPSWKMEFVSAGALDLTGYPPDTLIGNAEVAYGDLIHPEDCDRVWQEVQECLERGERFQLEYRIRTADGDEKWVWEQGVGIGSGDGEHEVLEGFIIDVTQRKRLMERVHQFEKLEAVGRLAGGVAHDFNNLLTAMIGYADLVMESLGSEHSCFDDVKEIRRVGERAAALTRQLLALSRQQPQQPRVVDINEVVHYVEKMLRRVLGSDIELTCELDPTAGTVRVDPSQMEQVLLNLAINARDAMPEGGKLTISTRPVEVDEESELANELEAGSYVCLTVRDRGVGMDDATREKIFEPFFTTKGERGTGLGLSTVYGIVQQTEGHISVSSEPGAGTSFDVYVPRKDGAVQTPSTAASETANDDPQGETIMVVDDSYEARKLIAQALETAGYTVVEARHADAALQLLDTYDTPIDLLVTDIVMPGLTGHCLAERVLERSPHLRVLYVSGHVEHAAVRDSTAVQEGNLNFLPKPFSATALRARVRAILDAD